MRSSYLEQNSGKYFQERPTVITDEFATTGTNGEYTSGIIKKVSIPAGAYVTKVALLCTAAIATQDLDVGDGSNVDRFIDGIVSASAGDMIVAPHTVGTTVAGGISGGKYYAAADTIDVITNITGTGDDEAGSAKLLVWYFV